MYPLTPVTLLKKRTQEPQDLNPHCVKYLISWNNNWRVMGYQDVVSQSHVFDGHRKPRLLCFTVQTSTKVWKLNKLHL